LFPQDGPRTRRWHNGLNNEELAESSGVLVKIRETAFLVALPLSLAISFGSKGILCPLLRGVVADEFAVYRIELQPFPMIVRTALTLAVRLTTNSLVGTELGWLKRLLAIAAD